MTKAQFVTVQSISNWFYYNH